MHILMITFNQMGSLKENIFEYRKKKRNEIMQS